MQAATSTPPPLRERPPPAVPAHRFCVAPMMEHTDRHCRAFHRLLTRRALLYTEMVTAAALVDGGRHDLLAFGGERPLALQIGGDDPGRLAAGATLAEQLGYDEVNLNVGCPSDRVQRGRFGACLMRQPEVVAEAVAAMRQRVAIPVTVKHRIGVDEMDGYEHLARFVAIVAAAGCSTFIVHARKAWLAGLSPRENREVPPLRYADVHRLKADFPHLEVVLNGGIGSVDEALHHLERVDGVMLGRAAYHQPWLLAQVDSRVFGDPGGGVACRREVVERMLPYVAAQLAGGERLHRVTRHLLGLFHGCPGARAWRRTLGEGARRPDAGIEVLGQALAAVEEGQETELPGTPRPG
ncbi:MAG TPA: tRNA dihydrouridine(20/20a) synthase DusA [Thermoanaerobaculia bacterium]|nr:tRNA dihydrouridine(20/20a) synthase DusA [Thermoanaerobaculia bacterium]